MINSNTLSSHVDVGNRKAELQYHGDYADLGEARRKKFLEHYDVEVRESYDWWTLSVMLDADKVKAIKFKDYEVEGEASLTFEKQGTTRRLVFQAKDTGKQVPPKKGNADDPSNYTPIWKFIPVGGRITQADGFIVSEDKRSCLLNLPKLDRMKKTPDGYLFSINWTVD